MQPTTASASVNFSTTDHGDPECHYDDRSLTSAGLVFHIVRYKRRCGRRAYVCGGNGGR